MDNVVVMENVADQAEQVEEQVSVGRECGPDRKTTVLKLVETFSGQGDVSEWLEKVQTICKLHGVYSEADLLYVVTLRVTGEAYQVLQQMSPRDRLSMQAVKDRLKEAYEANMFDAYDLFKARTWRKGESVDGYASALARLADLSGGATSQLLVAAFVSGLPANARNVIRSTAKPGQLCWSDTVSRARQVVNQMALDNAEQCLAMEDDDEQEKIRRARWPRKRTWCNVCKKTGHQLRGCPEVTCYACQKKGHIARKCPGNEGGEQA